MSPQTWTFLSNHAHVLVALSQDPRARIRDVAERVGITERAVLLILSDLEAEGIVRRHRQGRRNHYELLLDSALRHPLEQHRTVRELIEMLVGGVREPPSSATDQPSADGDGPVGPLKSG